MYAWRIAASVLIVRSPQIKGKGEEPLPEGAAYIVIVAKAGKGESSRTHPSCISCY
jgi:hypothetical protein